MRILRLSTLVSAFCFASLVAWPQQQAPPTASDPQAAALIQRALAAVAGSSHVSDATLTGTARRIAGSDDETGAAILTATSAGDSKVALAFPSGNRTEIRNHSAAPLPGALPPNTPSAAETPQAAGAWSGPDGALHPVVIHNLMTDPTWFFPAFTLASLVNSQNRVLSYIGQETMNGQTVLHVSSWRQFSPAVLGASSAINLGGGLSLPQVLEHLSQVDIYFDPATDLPLALAFNVHPDTNALVDVAVQIQFSSYQNISGVQAPTHVQKYLNYGLVLDLQFNDIKLNSGLSAAGFAIN
jgi:hypothetical protein